MVKRIPNFLSCFNSTFSVFNTSVSIHSCHARTGNTEACPYEAIYLDDNRMPHVIPDRCNGCGLCYTVCVSMQDASLVEGMSDRAIVVKPVR